MPSSTPSHSFDSSGACNSMQLDVEKVGPPYVVKLEIPPPLPDLALKVPEAWTFDRDRSAPAPIDKRPVRDSSGSRGAMSLRF